MPKKKTIIILIFIILLQVIFKIYLGYHKEDFFIDELYSYGLMNYKQAFIFEEETFKENWHNKEYFDDYLIVSEEEKGNLEAVHKNQMEDYHPPFYYLLLRVFASFSIGKFTKWTGLILNLFLFVCSAILVFFIGKTLFKNDKYSFILVFLYGFSKFSSENTLFIRMYQLLELQMLYLAYWYLKNSNKELKIKDLIFLGVSIVLGTLTQYYYIIFLLGICIIALTRYLKRKQIKNVVKFISVFIIAQIMINIIFPKYTDQLLGNTERSSSGNIPIAQKIERICMREREYFEIVNESMFHFKISYLLIWMTFLGIVLIVIKLIKDRKTKVTLKNHTNLISILVPTIFYWLVISITSPYIDLRYILPIFIFWLMIILYVLKQEIEIVCKNQKQAIMIIAIVSIFYTTAFWNQPNLRYQYKGSKNIIETIEKYKDIPCIYLYTENPVLRNDFVQNINYVRRFENVYILDGVNFSINKLKRVLKEVDISNGIILYGYKDEIDYKTYRIIKSMQEFKSYEPIVEITQERNYYNELYRIY